MTKVDVLLGLQWGDEGKGKVVDVLTPRYDVVARFQGGPNAGHTLEFDGHKYVLRSIPSGVFQNGSLNIIGNGVVLDPVLFMQEAKELERSGIDLRKVLKISRKAHLIMPTHRLLDAAGEKAKGKAKIGTTGKGIGPTYTDKVPAMACDSAIPNLISKSAISVPVTGMSKCLRLQKQICRSFPNLKKRGLRLSVILKLLTLSTLNIS